MDAPGDPRQLTYDFCTAFFAELAGHGVRDVVVSPGSRSTPLVVSARAVGALRRHVVLDERSAAFYALGLAKASRRPVALVCTSGTAAANHLPAVVEAGLTDVPLVVCTANRPPELQGWGAPQTIDQTHLFGTHVREHIAVPVPSEAPVALAPRLAARAVAAGGPVHLDWPFREPLEPAHPVAPVEATTVVRRPAPPPAPRPALDPDLAALERGLIVAGPRDAPVDDVVALARATGWPVFADPASQLRRGEHTAGTPLVWRAGLVEQPDVVVHVGRPPVRKELATWLASDPPDRVVLVAEAGHWDDPSFSTTDRLPAVPTVPGTGPVRTAWTRRWLEADAAAVVPDDGGLAGDVVRALPADGILYLANSMAIRYADRALAPGPVPLRVLCHRGANGIDGLVSAAAGAAAASGERVTLLTGDLAFLHDVGGLLAAARVERPPTIVVLDDDGGGIFQRLPVAALGEDVGFDELFRTPHGLDLAPAAALAGLSYGVAGSAAELTEHLDAGTTVIRVPL